MKRQEAPGPLELVRGFINTHDLEKGTDELSTPARTGAWLADRRLLRPTVPVDEPLRLRAVEIREALRSLAGANSGSGADPTALRALDELAGAAAVRLRFGPDGSQDVAPGCGTAPAGDVTGALGLLLAATARAAFDGTWRRLKVCPAPDCRWAFYDHSKNRSGTWCQMAECGNRAKARTFRTRHGGAAGADDGP
ncbi:CGNR zinc finger domain-containing protein [Kitasatospora sp. NPDC088346]|uniref:CGNR zinc finger domain-containing protein n=1 Tax=Kitasatospora sp. NPDC088346 TaxID=3364073 RepID=UPI0037F1E8C2